MRKAALVSDDDTECDRAPFIFISFLTFVSNE